MTFGNVFGIFLRDQHDLHASLFRAIGFFKHAAYGFDASLNGHFASYGYALPHGASGNRGNERRRNGYPCGRTVNAAAADNIDMQIKIRQIRANQLPHHRGSIEYRILGHRSGGIIEAHRAFAFFRRRKGHRFNFQDRAQIAGHA